MLIPTTRLLTITIIIVVSVVYTPLPMGGRVNATTCKGERQCSDMICEGLPGGGYPVRYTPTASGLCDSTESSLPVLLPLLAICGMLEVCGLFMASYEASTGSVGVMSAAACLFYCYIPLTIVGDGDYVVMLQAGLWCYYILSFTLCDIPAVLAGWLGGIREKVVIIVGSIVPAVASLFPLLVMILLPHTERNYGYTTILLVSSSGQPTPCGKDDGCSLTMCNLVYNNTALYVDIYYGKNGVAIGCGKVCNILPGWLCVLTFLLPLITLLTIPISTRISVKFTVITLSFGYSLFTLLIFSEAMYLGTVPFTILMLATLCSLLSTIWWIQRLYQLNTPTTLLDIQTPLIIP